MAKWYRRIISTVPRRVAGAGVIAIVILLSMAIVGRNVRFSVGGLHTLAQLLGVWLAFVLAGSLARDDRHIKIDFFTDKLPDRIQYYHNIIVLVGNLFVCVVLVYGSYIALGIFWDSVAPARLNIGPLSTSIPIYLYYFATLVGFGLISGVYLVELRVALLESRFLPDGILPALRSRAGMDGEDEDGGSRDDRGDDRDQ